MRKLFFVLVLSSSAIAAEPKSLFTIQYSSDYRNSGQAERDRLEARRNNLEKLYARYYPASCHPSREKLISPPKPTKSPGGAGKKINP